MGFSNYLPLIGTAAGAIAAPFTGGLSIPAGMAIGGAAGGAGKMALDASQAPLPPPAPIPQAAQPQGGPTMNPQLQELMARMQQRQGQQYQV